MRRMRESVSRMPVRYFFLPTAFLLESFIGAGGIESMNTRVPLRSLLSLCKPFAASVELSIDVRAKQNFFSVVL